MEEAFGQMQQRMMALEGELMQQLMRAALQGASVAASGSKTS